MKGIYPITIATGQPCKSGDDCPLWNDRLELSAGVGPYRYFVGETILSSYGSETAVAESVEYRRGIWRYLDVSASYIHEGGHVQSRRDGAAAQLWLTRGFFDDRPTLSAGVGPYVAITQNDDLPQNRTGDGRISGLLSVSASYRLRHHWLTRLPWNRIVTRYDRDTDLIEAGVGLLF
jgi:hypothetical protein